MGAIKVESQSAMWIIADVTRGVWIFDICLLVSNMLTRIFKIKEGKYRV